MSVDTRGPILNVGMKVRVGADGVEKGAYRFRNDCVKPTPWQASWIWLNSERYPDLDRTQSGGDVPVAALFRKEIELREAPRQALAWISADVSYRLYVNGRLAARGPADIGADWPGRGAPSTGRWLYDHRDLIPCFRKGRNVISVEVFTEPLVSWQLTRGRPGLLFEAELRMPDGSRVTVKTDDTWRAIPGEAFRMTEELPGTGQRVGRHLHEDLRREPSGWRLPEFDAAAWPACASVASTWNPLAASELPPLMEARIAPTQVTSTDPKVSIPDRPFAPGRSVVISGAGRFVVRFDRVLSAYVGLKVRGRVGTTLLIAPGEADGRNRIASVTLRDGVQTIELPFLDSFSRITIEAENVTSPVEILDVSAVFSSFPVAYRGAFSCSDEALNRIWESCRWAVQICMQTHHLDSPHHQEPLGDPGDYLIEALANYYAFGEPWLARQDLRKFGQILQSSHNHTFHTSYALLWLQMLLDYYDYTGDRALVAELAPTVHSLLATWKTYIGRNGLISEAPNYMFMDWVTIAGFECHHPPAVIGQGYITAFYFRALHDAARVAEITSELGLATEYNRLRKEVAKAFNRELWDSERGLYRDGRPFQTSVASGQWLPADREIETFSPHVNTLAVLYDLAPAERQAAIMERAVTTQPLNCQPYFMQFVLGALAHVDPLARTCPFDRYGASQMRRWKIDPETKTFHEMWNVGDLSHGWGAAPLIRMSATILGVTPLAPGFRTLRIGPHFCGLSWAKGQVPTPHGDVRVAWRHSATETRLEVTVPKGTEAEIVLPTAPFRSPTVTENGKAIWSGSAPIQRRTQRTASHVEGETLLVTVPAGSYRFTVSK